MKKKIDYTVTGHARYIRCAFLFLLSVYALDGMNRAFAQFLDQGAITGTVQDSTGATIPGADGSGVYVFSPIKIGRYK